MSIEITNLIQEMINSIDEYKGYDRMYIESIRGQHYLWIHHTSDSGDRFVGAYPTYKKATEAATKYYHM